MDDEIKVEVAILFSQFSDNMNGTPCAADGCCQRFFIFGRGGKSDPTCLVPELCLLSRKPAKILNSSETPDPGVLFIIVLMLKPLLVEFIF